MNIPTSEMDRIDYRILKVLSEDGRATDVAIGAEINLSSGAVARRRKILEESGVIAGYHAQIGMAALGFSGSVIVSVELTSQTEATLNEFEVEVKKCPSISFCGFVSGDTDFIMLMHVSSLDNYDKIYREEISKLPHVSKIKSSFILRQVANHSNPAIIFR